MTFSDSPGNSGYRTDLDGLRGIAIALVACFHVWFGRVSGGVDVFLTLSGYFFLGSLYRHAVWSADPRATFRETMNVWPRLERLLRRLLPALLTVLIGVAVLTLVILPRTRWNDVGREIVASALYYQNYYLAENSQDYLAASSANSPLQHLWSMSMQGQFFVAALVIAFAIAALLKALGTRLAVFTDPKTIRRVIGGTTALIAAASFYYAQARLGADQPYNYYDTAARLWEPLVGGLLAIWMPFRRISGRIRNLFALAAIAAIVSCGWWIDGVAEYPGPLALVPVGATLLIIWAGAGHRPTVNRCLAARPGVWLGTLAYALYLIHWPLLIFYLSWRGSEHTNALEGTAILAVSLGLAWLVKKYVEDPLRGGGRSILGDWHWPGRPRITYAAILTLILLLGSVTVGTASAVWDRNVGSASVDTRDLDPALYPGARELLGDAPVPAMPPRPTPLEAAHDYAETTLDGYMSDFEDTDFHVGVYGDPTATRTIALAGGSHAEMWISALDRIGRENGFRVTTYLKMGCPLTTEPTPARLDGTPYPICHDWVRKVMNEIVRTGTDAVFTNSTRPDTDGPADHTPEGYIGVFDEFARARIPVLGIRDVPWPHHRDGRDFNTPECLANGGTATTCGTQRSTALAAVDPIAEYARATPTFHPLDLSAGLCTDAFCPGIVGNIIVYKDFHHLSATYVRSLTGELSRQMALALPWTGPALS
ncbi:acyltransferase family protein [Gordonia zhaorongruii]|uniref:acyltransferase family protein n=1 Tax=Gordonia zhaorongruii TaxID=2597659 RepID=UPI001053CC5B|nr:acyltransferase family protein [Gordonia zhaorongruii]